jgi:hypothetical protein
VKISQQLKVLLIGSKQLHLRVKAFLVQNKGPGSKDARRILRTQIQGIKLFCQQTEKIFLSQVKFKQLILSNNSNKNPKQGIVSARHCKKCMRSIAHALTFAPSTLKQVKN